jgi:hypothetical protein
MTLASTPRKAGPFYGNGATTSFPFTFKVFDRAHVKVTRTVGGVNQLLLLDEEYTVTLNPDQTVSPGGAVVYPMTGSPMPVSESLTLTGAVPFDQPTDLPNGGNYRAETVENAMDYLAMQIQQIQQTALDLTPPGGDATSLALDLASPAASKGDALVTVFQPFTGAVARTQHDKNIDTGLYAEDFRLGSDPDDTLSIQRVLNLGQTCLLRANKTYTVQNLVGVVNTGLICPGGRAIVQLAAGANKQALTIDVSNFTLKGVNFNGGDTTDFKSFPAATIGTRCGVVVGAAFGTGRNLKEVSISDCDFYGFDKAGIWGREVMSGATIFGKKSSIHNVSAYTCYYGIWYDQRYEYVCTTNSYAYECRTGFYVQGGNNSFAACQANWCYDNFMLEFGDNDGHGQAVGCSFNHAFGGHNIFAKNVANGFTFVGCSMWFGNVEILGSYGICITDSVLANLVVNINGGGVNNVDNNYFVVAVSTAFVGNCFTTFRRNRDTYFATTINQDVNYGDLWMVARASSAIGVLQTNTTAAEFPLTYGTKKWMGKDLAALQVGQRAVIQKTGIVKTYVSIVFTTAAAAQVVRMKLSKFDRTATTVLEELDSAVNCPASTTGLTIERAVEWEFEYGEQIQIQLWTSSATGFTPTAIDVRHSLVY